MTKAVNRKIKDFASQYDMLRFVDCSRVFLEVRSCSVLGTTEMDVAGLCVDCCNPSACRMQSL